MKTRFLLLAPLVALGAILVLAQQRPTTGAKLDVTEAAKELKLPRKGWTDQLPAEGANGGQKEFQLPGAGGSAAQAVDLEPLRAALAMHAEYMKGLRARIDALDQQVALLREQVARLEQHPATASVTPHSR